MKRSRISEALFRISSWNDFILFLLQGGVFYTQLFTLRRSLPFPATFRPPWYASGSVCQHMESLFIFPFRHSGSFSLIFLCSSVGSISLSLCFCLLLSHFFCYLSNFGPHERFLFIRWEFSFSWSYIRFRRLFAGFGECLFRVGTADYFRRVIFIFFLLARCTIMRTSHIFL